MNWVFYIASAVAILATALVITRKEAVHSLLYLVVSLLAVALVFFVLGAPFIAALEVVVYAGAIVVLFIFVVMMLNLGKEAAEMESGWLDFSVWRGPAILVLILGAELIYALSSRGTRQPAVQMVGPKEVSLALFGPYVLAVELASMLLLAGLVGAYWLGRRVPNPKEEE